jgi:hypothetical protein
LQHKTIQCFKSIEQWPISICSKIKLIQMKNILFLVAIISFAACNSNTPAKSNDIIQTITDTIDAKPAPSIKEIVAGYLSMKNALASDNGNEAATAGNTMVSAFQQFDTSSLTAVQKKTYTDLEEDAREHAEHIGKNASNIPHQREHFDLLSKDMYELVKIFGGGQPLYQDYCPMYNDGKGATWLSEIKEIKNPYLGKKMPTCGSVKEELK